MLQANRLSVSGWVALLATCASLGCARGVSTDPYPEEEGASESDPSQRSGVAGEGAMAPTSEEPMLDEEIVAVADDPLLPAADDALEPADEPADCVPLVEGPYPAKTVVNDASAGDLGWLAPETVVGDTDLSASYAGLSKSHYLLARNFGLAIPDGATVQGIVVEWQRKALGPGIRDAEVLIVKNGAIGADNRARSEDWPTDAAPVWASYGLGATDDATDLWGEDWTASELNGEGFGVALSVSAGAAFVARVRVSVHYCL